MATSEEYVAKMSGDGDGVVSGGGVLSGTDRTTLTAMALDGSHLIGYRITKSIEGTDLTSGVNYAAGAEYSITLGVSRYDKEGEVTTYEFIFSKDAVLRVKILGYRLQAYWFFYGMNGASADSNRVDEDGGREKTYSFPRLLTSYSSAVANSTVAFYSENGYFVDDGRSDTDLAVLDSADNGLHSVRRYSMPTSYEDTRGQDVEHHVNLCVWHAHDGKMLWTGDGLPAFDSGGRLLCR